MEAQSRLQEFKAVHDVARTLSGFAKSNAMPDAILKQSKAIVEARAETVGGLVDWILAGGGRQENGVNLDFLHCQELQEILSCTVVTPTKSSSSMRIVCFDSLARARTTLSDFTMFYLPLHGLTRDDFFRWLPILVFVEACIYQLDEDNEKACLSGGGNRSSSSSSSSDQQPEVVGASSPSAAALHGVLKSRGLLTARVAAELRLGEQYWALERQLCGAMACGDVISVDDVYRCSSLKSFDYRCLHALLCELSGSSASDELLAFLAVDEVLTDMADDLFDYEKDVRKNSFNVLRGCVHAHGAEQAPLALAAKIGQLEREHEAKLQALPTRIREVYCANRRKAMAVPGSERWVFPPVATPEREAEIREAAAARKGKRSRGSNGDAPSGRGEPGNAGAASSDAESEVESDGEPSVQARRVSF